jgi:hypothetical protein
MGIDDKSAAAYYGDKGAGGITDVLRAIGDVGMGWRVLNDFHGLQEIGTYGTGGTGTNQTGGLATADAKTIGVLLQTVSALNDRGSWAMEASNLRDVLLGGGKTVVRGRFQIPTLSDGVNASCTRRASAMLSRLAAITSTPRASSTTSPATRHRTSSSSRARATACARAPTSALRRRPATWIRWRAEIAPTVRRSACSRRSPTHAAARRDDHDEHPDGGIAPCDAVPAHDQDSRRRRADRAH